MLTSFDGISPARADVDALDRAAAIMRDARRVLVITGAGMSADSGLPTYRGIGGLYDGDLTEDGRAIEEALSIDTFERDPALTWKYIAQIERACRGASPNAGHHALAAMADYFERFCVLTQNVDGFHRAAGSRDVIEMHGDTHRLYCMDCRHAFWVDNYGCFSALPPRCEQCGGPVRPAVVLFGEMLPLNAVSRYERALADGFDLVMVVGTSAVFPYIAAPVREAWKDGRATIEINPEPTEISRFCGITIQQRAAAALTEIGARLDQCQATASWRAR